MLTNEMILESKKELQKLCKEGTPQDLEDKMQEVIRGIVPKIVEKFPKLAEENPKEIGKIAKGAVFAYMQALAEY